MYIITYVSERDTIDTIRRELMSILMICEKHKLKGIVCIMKDAITFKFPTATQNFDSSYRLERQFLA